jgi:methionyl-tRNA formyltransferase
MEPGAVTCEGDRLLLGTTEGDLRVMALVPAGRRPMAGADFARGARFDSHTTWTAPE